MEDYVEEYKYSDVSGSKLYLFLAVLVPVVLHGFYDFFCLSISGSNIYFGNKYIPR